MTSKNEPIPYVEWFRRSSPYIHAHRGRTFVLLFGGEALGDDLEELLHDLAILNSLGIRLVLVHGIRPQIDRCLKKGKKASNYHNNLRITDAPALTCAEIAAGHARVQIEALLSMGLPNTPMSGARIRVASGNFVTSQPVGVQDGVDFMSTGEVRRIDTDAILRRLDDGDIVLLSPLGYSPTGEVFNLRSDDLAAATAIALEADKLILLSEGKGITDGRRRLMTQLSLAEADKLLDKKHLSNMNRSYLRAAVHSCRSGVRRSHIIPRATDGALLLELFTRDGIGTLISAEKYEDLRPAHINDVGGILALLAPLETQGMLVKRSRESLETDISHYSVIERDGMILGCAALLPYHKEKCAELTCLAIHPEYRHHGRGNDLLEALEKSAQMQGINQLFVLTTHTAHWFRERGFDSGDLKNLPVSRRQLYNYQRNSKIFIKNL